MSIVVTHPISLSEGVKLEQSQIPLRLFKTMLGLSKNVHTHEPSGLRYVVLQAVNIATQVIAAIIAVHDHKGVGIEFMAAALEIHPIHKLGGPSLNGKGRRGCLVLSTQHQHIESIWKIRINISLCHVRHLIN